MLHPALPSALNSRTVSTWCLASQPMNGNASYTDTKTARIKASLMTL
ncbi:MAG: hypothetical protein LBQ12_11340 [Deltaproteobacteria bacterium]|nr:hypothetical protein [Deltaproteobacteria bacterium]